MLTSKVAVVKSRHGISVKCSRYRDTGTTDPSLVDSRITLRFVVILLLYLTLNQLGNSWLLNVSVLFKQIWI